MFDAGCDVIDVALAVLPYNRKPRSQRRLSTVYGVPWSQSSLLSTRRRRLRCLRKLKRSNVESSSKRWPLRRTRTRQSALWERSLPSRKILVRLSRKLPRNTVAVSSAVAKPFGFISEKLRNASEKSHISSGLVEPPKQRKRRTASNWWNLSRAKLANWNSRRRRCSTLSI